MKCFSEACDRNQDPILAVLKEILPGSGRVLEIGSGTGQHAAYFSRALPDLNWQPSDLADAHLSIKAWREESGAPNLRVPIVIDLLSDNGSPGVVDAIVCINTIHIVAWAGVERLFSLAESILKPHGVLYCYGPYRYGDRALEPSNVAFDHWLKAQNPVSGVRDYEVIKALAESTGFYLGGDISMPANNRSIWWVRRTAPNASALSAA
jgi:SAM-dependent methyltransferase